jgi:hypothetical protein
LNFKFKAIEHYSSGSFSCACCGENFVEFLEIDHIKGGGQKHRQTLGKGSTMGNWFYNWLYKNNYPIGYQVLCSNCNFVKGNNIQRFCRVHHPELYPTKVEPKIFKTYGECVICGRDVLPAKNLIRGGKIRCQHKYTTKRPHTCSRRCYLKLNNYNSVQRGKIYKEKVLEHYSHGTFSCNCCGTSIKDFLVIDHIAGNGNKKFGHSGRRSGVGLYKYLIRNKFPEGYQVLCQNCNKLKGNEPTFYCKVHHPQPTS